jgi:signal peptidase II
VTDDSRSRLAGGGLPAGADPNPAKRRTGLGPDPDPETEAAATPRSTRRHWPLFVALAALVVLVDQVAKALIIRSLAPGQSVDIVGDLVRLVFGQNSGALFGLFKDNALMFGIVSLVVVGLIVAYHARSAASLYLTITLGFLLGGAIGNMLDRLRLGFVVDFVDVGIGPTRFYTFNVADSAISLAILLLFVAALRPSLVEGLRSNDAPAAEPATAAGAVDDWGDGLEPDDRPPTDIPAR